MKRLLLLLIAPALMLSSCQMARFDRIPGNYLDMIPTELQGTYKFYSKDYRSRRTDTLEIQINDQNIQMVSPTDKQVMTIHQQFQVYRLNHLFVIAKNDDLVHSLWNLILIEGKENGLRVYPVIDLKDVGSQESMLNRYLSFHDVILNHDPIQAAPSVTDGSVSVPTAIAGQPDNMRYFQVSEEQIFNYFERELKDKEYFFLKATARPTPNKVYMDKVKTETKKKKK